MNLLANTAFYVTFTCVAIPLGGGLAAGWTANHTADIAASWREGCGQLAIWRDQIAVNARPMARNLLAWLLDTLLPGKGQHRAKAVAQ